MLYTISVATILQVSASCLLLLRQRFPKVRWIAWLTVGLGALAFAVPTAWAGFEMAAVHALILTALVAAAIRLLIRKLRRHAFEQLAFRMMPGLVAMVGTALWLGRDLPGWALYAILPIALALSALGAFRSVLLGDLSGLLFEHPRRDEAQRTIERLKGGRQPRVCIHVPCYNEPPNLVARTLDALARLDYENYEVLVIDNNTIDPRVWRPIERKCAELGRRFRFLHVENLKGAKAGALNYALGHTGSEVELIAVVDADYIAERDFLKFARLFHDPRVGFVQTSHDYRKWRNTRFLRGAYYAYVPYHKTTLPVLNEFSSSFTVGTMCLLRKEALERAGGWSEWCLTEDSEIAIRIHALGYVGHTFADTAGRGLIPETIKEMKKQQFRWTAGPVQQLLLHWRLMLGISKTGSLTQTQRLLALHHSLTRLTPALGSLLNLGLLAVLTVVTLNAPDVSIPGWIAIAIAAGMLSTLLDSAVIVRLSGGSGIRDQLYSDLIWNALAWVHLYASLAPLVRSEFKWRRTNKSTESASFLRTLNATPVETLLGIILTVAAVLLIVQAPELAFNQHTWLAALLTIRGFVYLCAPLIGLVAELDLARAASDPPTAGQPEGELARDMV